MFTSGDSNDVTDYSGKANVWPIRGTRTQICRTQLRLTACIERHPICDENVLDTADNSDCFAHTERKSWVVAAATNMFGHQKSRSQDYLISYIFRTIWERMQSVGVMGSWWSAVLDWPMLVKLFEEWNTIERLHKWTRVGMTNQSDSVTYCVAGDAHMLGHLHRGLKDRRVRVCEGNDLTSTRLMINM